MEPVTNVMKDMFGYLTTQWTWWMSFIQGEMLNKKTALLSDEAYNLE